MADTLDAPLVSVIVPCYNAEPFIAETLASVYAQAGMHFEVIVVDDGSTDESAQIVRERFPAARLIQTPNRGPSHARNTGTREARGAYIQYLDADDMLAPGKVQRQVEALANSGADVAYGDWQRLVPDIDGAFVTGEVVRRQIRPPAEIDLFVDFWCPPAVYLFRREIVEKVGTWNENLPIIQDARFALDCALHGGSFIYVPEMMAAYRDHRSGSVSTRDPRAFRRDCLHSADEVEAWWRARGGLDEARCKALLQVYGQVARGSYADDRPVFALAYAALVHLQPGYIPSKPRTLAWLSRGLGYPRAEAVALAYRKLKKMIGV